MSGIKKDENGIETRMNEGVLEHRHEKGGYGYFHPENKLHKSEEPNETVELPVGHILANGKVVEKSPQKETIKIVKFVEKKTLANRDAINPMPDEDVEGVLLVAEEPALTWEDGHIRFGHDYNSLFPAVYKGEKAWLLQAVWQPVRGYCASGTTESILNFENGAKILIDQGKFSFSMGT